MRGVDSISQKKKGAVCYIDGGKKMNNSQNKNCLIWKKLMGFALFLGNLFQQLYNTADSLIVETFWEVMHWLR